MSHMETFEELISAAGPLPIIAAVFGLVAVLVVAGYYTGTVRPLRRRRRILESGEPAEATVLEVRDTGGREVSGIVVEIDLEVRRAGHAPYRATTLYHWRRSRSIYQNPPVPPPGSIVRVMVDRDNPRLVELAEPAQGSSAGAPTIALRRQTDAEGPPQVFSAQVYVIDGKQYTSPDEMPPELRAKFERLQQVFSDENRDGMPDILEQLSDSLQPEGGNVARLRELKTMHEQGLISAAEYEAKRAEILGRM